MKPHKHSLLGSWSPEQVLKMIRAEQRKEAQQERGKQILTALSVERGQRVRLVSTT